MKRGDSLSFIQTLRTPWDTITDRWCRQIATTSDGPRNGVEVCQHLVELSIKAIRLLLDEPFEHEKVEEIGATLARLHYLQPEALGGILRVLASHLVEGLPPDSVAALQPRLAEMLGGLATGFFHQARQTIIEEQEEIQNELSAQQGKAERELRIVKSAITSSINAIAMADMEGNIAYVNRSFLDMWGYDKVEEVLGKPALEFWQKREKASAVLKAVRSRMNWKGELVARRKDGSPFDVHLSANVVTDEYGRIICMMGSFVDITEQKQMEKALRESKTNLEERTRSLEEVNTALKVLLERRAEDKNALEERLRFNAKELVFPLLKKLRNTSLNPKQLSFLDVIESNLKNITSSFSHALSSRHQGLTPAEIRVADQIREGRNTKEIAQLMNLSPRTIESHRENLRRKMKIQDRKENLRSHLLSLI